ncbi:hypothetical protein LTS18_003534 [Coniosporium uncinatum]|uniref:Uncharacterized protein n=1 Tax=Coniosporium uncinatum TaxID=93489 RepID=A0ACC3DT41_9PEZI|nr:hypothetical protein LTS18_003534 [Coniosporium uncinatum]
MSDPAVTTRETITKPTNPDGLILEAWAQGFMVGSLIVMACITIANMRRKVLLHKLILVEVSCIVYHYPLDPCETPWRRRTMLTSDHALSSQLIFGTFHGTFIFTHAPVYGWYLSATAIFLNVSWSMHNFIAWMKNKPFLSRRVSLIYVGTVILAQPYWVVEIYANFTYFNNINDFFVHTRPYEAIFRDPWWIFTCCNLFWNIKRRYDFSILQVVRTSPRFGIMLGSMVLSVCFIVVDIVSVTHVFNPHALPDGINPFWKMAFVFKCLTDTIILDDFKTALDRLHRVKMDQLGQWTGDGYGRTGSTGSALHDSDGYRGYGGGPPPPLGRLPSSPRINVANVGDGGPKGVKEISHLEDVEHGRDGGGMSFMDALRMPERPSPVDSRGSSWRR